MEKDQGGVEGDPVWVEDDLGGVEDDLGGIEEEDLGEVKQDPGPPWCVKAVVRSGSPMYRQVPGRRGRCELNDA